MEPADTTLTELTSEPGVDTGHTTPSQWTFTADVHPSPSEPRTPPAR